LTRRGSGPAAESFGYEPFAALVGRVGARVAGAEEMADRRLRHELDAVPQDAVDLDADRRWVSFQSRGRVGTEALVQPLTPPREFVCRSWQNESNRSNGQRPSMLTTRVLRRMSSPSRIGDRRRGHDVRLVRVVPVVALARVACVEDIADRRRVDGRFVDERRGAKVVIRDLAQSRAVALLASRTRGCDGCRSRARRGAGVGMGIRSRSDRSRAPMRVGKRLCAQTSTVSACTPPCAAASTSVERSRTVPVHQDAWHTRSWSSCYAPHTKFPTGASPSP
jgi:hypothetical protein